MEAFASWNMERILRGARHFGASDIHLVQGFAPLFRVNGEIRCIEGASLDEETHNRLFIEMSSERQRKIFADEMQLSVSRNWPSLGRFRTSVYMHGGCPEMAIRLCETVVRSAEELSLPEVVRDFSRLPNGLILVTGATGTGKTTTLNYMIDQINRERRCKIITIEDPVEFVHENLRSVIVQLEVSTDTPSFRKALVHVLRQDPDVIAVGEMRDLENGDRNRAHRRRNRPSRSRHAPHARCHANRSADFQCLSGRAAKLHPCPIVELLASRALPTALAAC